MKLRYLTALLIAFSQPYLSADNISSNSKQHILSANLGIGSTETDLFTESGDLSTWSILYGYKYDSTWTINTELIFADDLECFISCMSDVLNIRHIDYNALILNVQGSLPLSERWSMFGKLGFNYYRSDFYGGNKPRINNNGLGSFAAAGFNFRAFNGFGLGFEGKKLSMGDIDSTIYSLNFSYMF